MYGKYKGKIKMIKDKNKKSPLGEREKLLRFFLIEMLDDIMNQRFRVFL